MFEPKKAIPPIAAAMLALTGCGDSAGGDGGTGATGTGGDGGTGATGTGGDGGTGGVTPGELQAALDDYCMKLVECNNLNAEPEPGFGTVEACKQNDSIAALYDYAESVGGDCAAAVTDYWYCVAENECLEFIQGSGIFIHTCDDEESKNGPEEACPDFFAPPI